MIRNNIFICIVLFTIACSGHACAGLLIYGIEKQDAGMGVLMIDEHQSHVVALANTLRPDGVQEDWTRQFGPILPIGVRSGYLYYFIFMKEDNNRTGIYRKRMNTPDGPEFCVKSPRLLSVQARTNGESFSILGVTELGDVCILDLLTKKTTFLGLNHSVFASWDEGGAAIVLRQIEGNASILSVNLEGREEVIAMWRANNHVNKAFALGGGRYLVLDGSNVKVLNSKMGLYEKRSDLRYPFINSLLVDSAGKNIYVLVPMENDGDILYKVGIDSIVGCEILRGVFSSQMSWEGSN